MLVKYPKGNFQELLFDLIVARGTDVYNFMYENVAINAKIVITIWTTVSTQRADAFITTKLTTGRIVTLLER